ncbi:hypothetical protein AB0M54_17440 [Actinoplanes sp. NPDC051470]|uniref:hypothetical protein n=1 Tax=Actinoplanes sp. NPDC051470 TaxID=3157224 RepID=UPI0034374199
MDTQRQAFLATLEAELVDLSPSRTAADSILDRPSRGAGIAVKRSVFCTLLAGASMLAVGAAPAQAASAPSAATSGPVIQSDCFTPDFVRRDHTKTCGNPQAFVNYYFVDEDWITSYYVCYIFEGSWYGCGGSTPLPDSSACGRP